MQRTVNTSRGWPLPLRVTASDALVVSWAVTGAQIVRFSLANPDNAVPVTTVWDISFVVISAVVALLWLAALRWHGAYEPRALGHGAHEYRAVVAATLRLFATVAIVSYLLALDLARGYLLVALPAGLLLLLITRRLWRVWLARQRASGSFTCPTLVVGDAEHLGHLIRVLQGAPEAGFQVVGACCDDATDIAGIPVVGSESEAAATAVRMGVGAVACAASWRQGTGALRRLGWDLESTPIDLVVSPGLTDVAGPRIHVRPVGGLPLLYVEAPAFSGQLVRAKRVFDVLFAGLALLVCAPLLIVVAVLIKGEDGGPAFYHQWRTGLNGRQFRIHKLRSMRVDADQIALPDNDADGPLFKLRHDPRVTRMGQFIRPTSIDELPQLWNVVKGEMSLVGPRPLPVAQAAAIEEDGNRRLLVKPGLTGLWQVSGRSDLSWEDSIRLDLYYVENWSFTGDMRILWRTFRAVREHHGAY